MSEDQNAPARPFETLELLAAILLGVAAIATALASYESSLYGGKSVENYAKQTRLRPALPRSEVELLSKWRETARLKWTPGA